MIDRIKKAAVYGAILAVAGVFALAAAFCAVFGLLGMVMDEPWAAALTALAFSVLFFVLAQTRRPSKAGRHEHAEGGEHHGLAGLAGGLPSHLAGLPAQIAALIKGKPLLAYAAGAVAAIILIRKPGLIWLIGSNLLGMRVQKRRDRRHGMWTRP